ncbi:MAG: ZIP family metal transporter [Nanoarchaeota archaeon]|nr:ZIP family metal transporter [Nanoarchaeota archaeon]
MALQIIYAILSVFIVSLLSFIGVISLGIKAKNLQTILIYVISFSAGALFGDAFIHLIPDIVKERGFDLIVSFSVLGGVVIFFVLEKIIHWQHYHMGDNHSHKEKHILPLAYVNLLGSAVHNFIDGVIIAASYLITIPAGIATTIAVILHEIPHEFGDFAILVHGGFSQKKALFLNFISALFAVLGTILTLWLGTKIQNIQLILIPIAAGGFIYIAGSDLIPELHKHTGSGKFRESFFQLLAFLAGMIVMALILFIE